MEVDAAAGMRYFDLYHGVELKPETRSRGEHVLGFSMEAQWLWRAYSRRRATRMRDSMTLMAKMKAMTACAAGELFA